MLRPRDGGGVEASADVIAPGVDVPDAATVSDAAVTDVAETLEVPRLTRPLSFAVVGTALPELRWVLPERASGAQVQVCDDSACMRGVQTIDAQGNVVRLTASLAQRAYFWRVRARYGERFSAWSPSWEFLVQGNANVMVSWYGFTDFDRDGSADIVVGAPGANGGRGAVLVYRGKMDPANLPYSVLAGGAEERDVGGAVTLGDVDGDGIADVVCTGSISTPSGPRGGLHVVSFAAVPAGLPTIRRLSESDDTARVSSVSFVGDVDGDGYGDVAVGSPTAQNLQGELRVLLGSATGLSSTRSVVIQPGTDYRSLGNTILATGDLNRDRLDDFLVTSLSLIGQTQAHSVRGRSPLLAQSVAVMPVATGGLQDVGRSTTALGDLNADGANDFLLGAESGEVALYLSELTTAAEERMPTAIRASTGCAKAGPGAVGRFGFANELGSFLLQCQLEPMRSEIIRMRWEAGVLRRVAGAFAAPSSADRDFGGASSSSGDFNADGVADVVIVRRTDGQPDALEVAGRMPDGRAWTVRLGSNPGQPVGNVLVLPQ
ncbi:MAG: VCBS repeat-containing protein [Polyangiales bacterium]